MKCKARSGLSAKSTKPIIGLCGGIGAGKSTVALMLQSLGAAAIDSDQLSHEQLELPDVQEELRACFGEGVIDPTGQVNRKALADIVFQDDEALQRLQDIIYPRIEQRRVELTEAYDSDPSVRAIVYDSPKLQEAGLDKLCFAVIFVDVSRAERLRRVSESRGWSEQELDRREKRQKPLDEKKAGADYIVGNNSTTADLRTELGRLLASILDRFHASCREDRQAR